MSQKPSIGRIVLYRPESSESLLPAIITRVWSDDCVNLHVFGGELPDSQGIFPTSVLRCPTDDGTMPRSWSWPPRV